MINLIGFPESGFADPIALSRSLPGHDSRPLISVRVGLGSTCRVRSLGCSHLRFCQVIRGAPHALLQHVYPVPRLLQQSFLLIELPLRTLGGRLSVPEMHIRHLRCLRQGLQLKSIRNWTSPCLSIVHLIRNFSHFCSLSPPLSLSTIFLVQISFNYAEIKFSFSLYLQRHSSSCNGI